MINARRGHESRPHIEAKVSVGKLFPTPEWSIFLEQCDADILVHHNPSGVLVAIEVESTPRNVLRNIQRDLSNDCHAVATVSLQARYHRQICNKIRKHYPEAFGTHLQAFSYDAPGLQQLVHWIEELVSSHARTGSIENNQPETKENNP
jgi:hypothetical protein